MNAIGSGIHFCIGAVLARREMNVTVNAILDLYPDLKLADPAGTHNRRHAARSACVADPARLNVE